MRTWATLTANVESGGRKTPVMVGMLMATAQSHGMTIVTCNVRDFAV